MRRLLPVILLLCACTVLWADGRPTQIRWYGWTVASDETFFDGRKHSSFPLTYLVDGDPSTAWVFSGKKMELKDPSHNGEFSLMFQADKQITVDGIRIMNGYNKSKKLFLRNNRVTKVTISKNVYPLYPEKNIKTVGLSDSMGWHDISIPRQKVRSLGIAFNSIKKGTDDDTCISEIQLLDHGRPIPMNMPRAVIYLEGGDCGCDGGSSTALVRRDGRTIVGGGTLDCTDHLFWGVEEYHKRRVLWIADARTAKIILRKYLGLTDEIEVRNSQWLGPHKLSIMTSNLKTKKEKELIVRIPNRS